ncbi:MAG: sugar phosphate isomerase/epimerase [Planctomycetota bacterium]|nr:sugar phosphate isomerase/epimerase [Planctomycetota bacterium]
MPKPLSIQLYTLRDEIKKQGFPAILKLVADIGYKGVELAGLHDIPAADVKKILGEYKLGIAGAHVGVFDKKNEAAIIGDAQTFGYKYVVTSPPRDAFDSDDGVKKLSETINDATARFGKAGLKVLLHNHWWEFATPSRAELLTKLCPDVGWQQDIYWVQTSGQDPVANIKKYADKTFLLHVKDGPCDKDKAMTAVGKGKVDVKGCLAAAEASKVEWYSVELDRCDTDMVQAVKDSYAYLTQNKLAAGNK